MADIEAAKVAGGSGSVRVERIEDMTEEERRALLARRTPRSPEGSGSAVAYIESRPAAAVTDMTIRLAGPIESLDLALERDVEGPLAATGILQARAAPAAGP